MGNLLTRNHVKNILRNGSPHGYIHPSVVDRRPTHCNKKKTNIKIQVVHHAFHLVTISGSVLSYSTVSPHALADRKIWCNRLSTNLFLLSPDGNSFVNRSASFS